MCCSSISGSRIPSGRPPQSIPACRIAKSGRIFQPVQALAVNRDSGLLMCGGPVGVYRSADGGATFEPCSSRELSSTRVTLPDTWLFCSAEHDVIVEGEGDARRD